MQIFNCLLLHSGRYSNELDQELMALFNWLSMMSSVEAIGLYFIAVWCAAFEAREMTIWFWMTRYHNWSPPSSQHEPFAWTKLVDMIKHARMKPKNAIDRFSIRQFPLKAPLAVILPSQLPCHVVMRICESCLYLADELDRLRISSRYDRSMMERYDLFPYPLHV